MGRTPEKKTYPVYEAMKEMLMLCRNCLLENKTGFFIFILLQLWDNCNEKTTGNVLKIVDSSGTLTQLTKQECLSKIQNQMAKNKQKKQSDRTERSDL